MRSDIAFAADDAQFGLDEVAHGIPPMFIVKQIIGLLRRRDELYSHRGAEIRRRGEVPVRDEPGVIAATSDISKSWFDDLLKDPQDIVVAAGQKASQDVYQFSV
jgi:hypothetical protein